MFIETETTPNPLSLKFIPDKPVMEKGTVHFTNPEEAKASPLAETLFRFDNVAGVLLAPGFLSVTLKAGDWREMKPKILGAIMEHFTSGRPVFVKTGSTPKTEKPSVTDSDVVRQIKEILDEKIRPAVARDGGDVVFERFEGGVVYLNMQGSCHGCPSSVYTLKNGIENVLKYYVPEVEEVQPV